jgi:hypothetical protein
MLPWRHLIEARNSGFDPTLEPDPTRLRASRFYGPLREFPSR